MKSRFHTKKLMFHSWTIVNRRWSTKELCCKWKKALFSKHSERCLMNRNWETKMKNRDPDRFSGRNEPWPRCEGYIVLKRSFNIILICKKVCIGAASESRKHLQPTAYPVVHNYPNVKNLYCRDTHWRRSQYICSKRQRPIICRTNARKTGWKTADQ